MRSYTYAHLYHMKLRGIWICVTDRQDNHMTNEGY